MRSSSLVFQSVSRATSSALRGGASSFFHAPTPTTAHLSLLPPPLLRIPTASYHERVIDHYEKPRNVGSMNKNDPDVGTGFVGAPACGDVMKLQIKVDENGIVVDSVFKTFGCGSAIASSSYVTELIKNKSIDEIKKIKNSDIAKYLSLPPVKLHCSMLAEDAIKAAIKDWETKKARAGPASPTASLQSSTSNATTTAPSS